MGIPDERNAMDHHYPYKDEAQAIRDMILLENESLQFQDDLPESSHAFLSLALILGQEDMLLGKARRSTKKPSALFLQVLTPKRCIIVTIDNEFPPALRITPFTYNNLVVIPKWSETGDSITVEGYKVQIEGTSADHAASFDFTYDIDHFIDPDLQDLAQKVSKLKSLLQ